MKSFRFFLTVLLYLISLQALATEWNEHPSNPIFPGDVTGLWSNPFFESFVLHDDTEPTNKFKMWYVGGEVPGEEGESIGYATSVDGINWIDHPGNPLFSHGGSWDANGIINLSVIKDGATYKMWYSGVNSLGEEQIGYATSADGLSWTPHAGNPVFPVGTAGSWDEDDVGDPYVIKESGSYRLWYGGDGASIGGEGRIGLATSSDGISWSRVGVDGQIFAKDNALSWQNGEGVGSPVVTKAGSNYTMAYAAADAADIVRVGLAHSVDGIVWSREPLPIISEGNAGLWNDEGLFPVSQANVDGCEYIWVAGFSNSPFLASTGVYSPCFSSYAVPLFNLPLLIMLAGALIFIYQFTTRRQ